VVWSRGYFLAWGLLMVAETLSALAIAGSVASLSLSLVCVIRSIPSRVRQNAANALEIAEETQSGFRAAAQRMLTFEAEIIREREAAAADLVEAERKRRQAAAKLSKLGAGANGNDPEPPQTIGAMLATLQPGDPRRLALLRAHNRSAGQGTDDHS